MNTFENMKLFGRLKEPLQLLQLGLYLRNLRFCNTRCLLGTLHLNIANFLHNFKK